MTKQPTSGRIKLDNGGEFTWTISGDTHPEIHGALWHKDGRIVKGSSGWYRTTDPEAALARARQWLAA